MCVSGIRSCLRALPRLPVSAWCLRVVMALGVLVGLNRLMFDFAGFFALLLYLVVWNDLSESKREAPANKGRGD